jgi:predicted Zn finger-like uncharacterized protein
MALATQCPHCFTIFRVAGDQLKLRGGLVRCGSCRQVFNGQEFLVEASISDGHYQPAPGSKARFGGPQAASSSAVPPPAGAIPEVNQVAAGEPPAAGQPAPAATAFAAPVPSAPEPKVFRSPASPGYVPLNAASEESMAADVPDVDEEIGGAALLRRSSADREDEATEAAEAAETHPRADDDPFKAYEEAIAADAGQDDAEAGARDEGEDDEAEVEAPAFVRNAERKERVGHVMKIVMMVAAGVMVPVLLLQSIYYWRNQLAVAAPPLRPMLNGMCAAFHCTVGLPAQIDRLTLESNELQVVPPNQNIYALALVLRNRSGEPQAWPHIELTLNNDDEKPVVRRVFRPREYLATPQLLDAGIAGESEQQVKLTFELSDALVSGYRIYLFYP